MKNIFMILLLSQLTFADENILSGNLKTDLLFFKIDSVKNFSNIKLRRNPMLMGTYSFLIPGLGQYKTDRITQSIIFSAIEITTVAAFLYLENEGDKKTIDYKNYANNNWSVVKYAEWINIYGAEYGDSTKIYINPNTNLKPWERVSWSDVNKWENSSHKQGGFTHHLPAHGEQQYFELIGKYIQYKFGWKDYTYSGNALSKSDIPKQVDDYMNERGKANQMYYNAGLITGIIFINHLVSALDAVYGTSTYNKNVSANIGIENINYAGRKNIYPVLKLTVKL